VATEASDSRASTSSSSAGAARSRDDRFMAGRLAKARAGHGRGPARARMPGPVHHGTRDWRNRPKVLTCPISWLAVCARLGMIGRPAARRARATQVLQVLKR
jgi:hypothetical protein